MLKTKSLSSAIALALGFLLASNRGVAMAQDAYGSLQKMPLIDCLQEISRSYSVRIVYAGNLAQSTCSMMGRGEDLASDLSRSLLRTNLRWRRNANGDVIVYQTGPQLMTVALRSLTVTPEPEINSNMTALGVGAESQDDALTIISEGRIFGIAKPEAVLKQPDLNALARPDLENIMRYAPNVYGSGTAYAIRGVWRDSGERLYSNVFLDEMPVPVEVLDSGTLDVLQLDQVDFLYGPQPAVSSSAALGGALLLHTPPTSVQNEWQVSGHLDQGGGNGAGLVWQGVMGQGDWSGRATVTNRNTAGSICSRDGSRCDLDALDTQTLLFKSRYEPEQLPELDLRFNLLLTQSDAGDDFLGSAPGIPPSAFEFDRVNYFTATTQRESTTLGVALNADWRLRQGSLFWRSYFTQSDANIKARDANVAWNERLPLKNLDEQRSKVEMGYRMPFAHGEFTVGINNELRDLPQQRFQYQSITAGATLPTQVEPFSLLRHLEQTDFHTQTNGFFASLDYDFSPRLHAGLGLRWVDESVRESILMRRDLTNPNCVIRSGFTTVTTTPCLQAFPVQQTQGSAKSSHQSLLPSLALKFEVTDAHDLVFSGQRGFASGGSNDGLTLALDNDYAPEQSDLVNLGWRAEWVPSILQTDVNVFYTDWRDRQVNQFDPALNRVVVKNVGRSHAYGAESNLRWRIHENWKLRLGLGFLRTRMDTFLQSDQSGSVDFSGGELPYSPHFTGVMGLNWKRGPWFADLAAYHAAKAYSDLGNVCANQLPAYTSVDANVGYTATQWQLSVWTKNALDATVVESTILLNSADVPYAYQLGDPRQFGLAFRYSF